MTSSRLIPLACLYLALAALGQALQWQEHGSHRLAKLTIKPSDRDGFLLTSPEKTGVQFANKLSRLLVAKNRNLANGSGVAIGDIDGDGLADVYFCGLQTDNKLYRNLGGWKFEDISNTSGVTCPRQYSTGALIEDVDGDGDNDLLVTGLAKGTRLFLNNGSGQFTEKTNSGLFPKLGATSMAMADIDQDGDLDLYVTNYRTTNHKDRPPGVNVSVTQEGDRIIVTPSNRFTYLKSNRPGGVNIVELGEPDFLYKNNGEGVFKPVNWTSGDFLDAQGNRLTKPPLDWGLSVAMRDFNNDQLPDIYVCNDYFYSVDKFWLNQGDGTFKLADHHVVRNFSMSSMSVDCADINLDGYHDFFVADMLSRRMSFRHTQRANVLSPDIHIPVSETTYQPEFARNTLQLGRGDGTFVEIAQFAGLDASEWTWSSRFLDVDLDGYQDLIVTTGNEADVLDADMLRVVAQSPKTRDDHVRNMMNFPRLKTPNLIFHNDGSLAFSERGEDLGFDHVGISHGMAAGDLDNDGDLDLAINNLNEPASLYENLATAHRVAVRLKGLKDNTHAVGAEVIFENHMGQHSRQIISGGRYLSGDQPQVVFGIPNEDTTVAVRIRWPNDRTSNVENIPVNSLIEVSQSHSTTTEKPTEHNKIVPLFKEARLPDAFAHRENSFNDYDARPLLASRESTLGPGLSAVDLDGDFIDEILMGTGKGSIPKGIMRSPNKPDTFELIHWGGSSKAIRDILSLGVAPKLKGKRMLLATQSNLEDGLTIGSSVSQIQDSAWSKIDEAGVFGAGPVALADVDSDGDVDLFVGGMANHSDSYLNISSYLFLNSGDDFELTDTGRALNHIGSVTGAVFTDVDNDRDPDLLLARRWNSPLLLINDQGNFTDRTEEWGLSELKGLWHGVSTGDFNNDGRMDFIMTNLGKNNKYTRYLDQEIWLHLGDFNGDGISEGVESIVDPFLQKRVPMRDLDTLSKVMPWVHDMFPSYHAFGQAPIETLLGPVETPPVILKLNTLDTSIFLNLGNRFARKNLPSECQFTPAMGCSVSDFDGDGNEDIYLAQNFFDVERETSRHDAGLGQVLLGNGNGEFRALTRLQSGVAALGQARACVVSDFNGDGRVDIATTQNNDRTLVYLNQGGQFGLRVFLVGTQKNPTAVGATLTLISEGNSGPKREIRLGSGYLSQDGLGQVFTTADKESVLRVQWPSGDSAEYKLPDTAKTITISEKGGIHVVQ